MTGSVYKHLLFIASKKWQYHIIINCNVTVIWICRDGVILNMICGSFQRSMEFISVGKEASMRPSPLTVRSSRGRLSCKSQTRRQNVLIICVCVCLNRNNPDKSNRSASCWLCGLCFSDSAETVIHSADAFAPVGYLRFTRMHTEDKKEVWLSPVLHLITSFVPEVHLLYEVSHVNVNELKVVMSERLAFCCIVSVNWKMNWRWSFELWILQCVTHEVKVFYLKFSMLKVFTYWCYSQNGSFTTN